LKAASLTSAGTVVACESNLILPPSFFVAASVDFSLAIFVKSPPSVISFLTALASSSEATWIICASTSGWKLAQAVFKSSSVIFKWAFRPAS